MYNKFDSPRCRAVAAGELPKSLTQSVTRHDLLKKLGSRVARVRLAVLVMTILGLSSGRATPTQEAYVKASNTGAGDGFGVSVAASGDTIVIGAPYEASSAVGINGNQNDNSAPNSGAAYVFVRNGRTWSQQAYLKASNTHGNQHFGGAVAISGETIVVSAVLESSNATGVNGDQSNESASESGAAYVFVRNGTTWSQQAYLKASNTDAYDHFAGSVAISADTVVVGADRESSNATGVNGDEGNNSAGLSGAAYVFVRNGPDWSQQAYLKASNTEANDAFGWSVSVSGDTVVVSAVGEDSNATGVNGDQNNNSASQSGVAYVFARNGTEWSQQAYLKGSNTEAIDQFGWSVSLSGDLVAIGARGEDSNSTGVNGNQTDNTATNSGAVYVFVRSGTTWNQQAYLKASNTGTGDAFGISVAASGDMIIVGGDGEDSNANGVNGDQSNNSANGSGAAYVFVRSGTNWNQHAYLKASNTDAGDEFSYSVGVSGNTAVVGAFTEDSNAGGVDGNQNDNGAAESGAAYVFTGLDVGPRLAITPDGIGGYFIRLTGAANVTYRLQRASSVTGPWDAIATNSAPGSGSIEFHEANPLASQAFYRTVTP